MIIFKFTEKYDENQKTYKQQKFQQQICREFINVFNSSAIRFHTKNI